MSFFSYANFLPNLVDRHIKNIHQRQTAILIIQFLLIGLSLWFIALVTGVSFLTYMASLLLTQQTLETALLIGVSTIVGISLVLDVKPIYLDKIKAIDSFAIAPEKIAFIKREVTELSKKANVDVPDICFEKQSTFINARYDHGVFKNGKIIFTAGFLRSYGMGGLTDRDVRATIAHELGHKISRDLFYIIILLGSLALTASALITAWVELVTLSSIMVLQPVLLALGLFLMVTSSFSLFLKYRENAEVAADIRGVGLTNDANGMSNKGISRQQKKINTLKMLSFLDKQQVGLYIKSLVSLKIPATLEKIKEVLLKNISYRKKQKKLINSSMLDPYWEKKMATLTGRFIVKHRDSLNARSKQESANKGLVTRFKYFMQSAMNPYPSDEARANEVQSHFANKKNKASAA